MASVFVHLYTRDVRGRGNSESPTSTTPSNMLKHSKEVLSTASRFNRPNPTKVLSTKGPLDPMAPEEPHLAANSEKNSKSVALTSPHLLEGKFLEHFETDSSFGNAGCFTHPVLPALRGTRYSPTPKRLVSVCRSTHLAPPNLRSLLGYSKACGGSPVCAWVDGNRSQKHLQETTTADGQ